MRYTHQGKLSLILIFLWVLSSCSSDNGSTPSAIDYPLTGSAVKGPLANAQVNVYLIDTQQPDRRGAVIATGNTTAQALIDGIVIPSPLLDGYLIEITADSDTLDVSTNMRPVITKLRGIVTADHLTNNLPVSITPATTLATDIGVLQTAENASAVELLSNIQTSAVTVIKQLGFGLEAGIDIFSVQALITDSSQSLADTAAYRTSIEALTALIGLLQASSSAEPDELLRAFAQDLMDGRLDSANDSAAIPTLSEIPNIGSLLESATISLLPIPNTDQDGDRATDDPYIVDDVEKMLIIEAETLGVDKDVSALSDGSIAIVAAPLSTDTDTDGIPDISDADIDNDGVSNIDDAFPYERGESGDSDNDTVGDNADAYPNDAACSLLIDGNGTACYATLLRSESIEIIVSDELGVIYMYVPSLSSVLRYDSRVEHYLPVINIEQSDALTWLATSSNHSRLYLGYANGAITFINLFVPPVEQAFAELPQAVSGLVGVGEYLLAVDSSGARNTHYVFGANGGLTDTADWNDGSPVYAWNEVNDRVYFFRQESSAPDNLFYEVINQTTGRITSRGEAPYEGIYSIEAPIQISVAGDRVLLGSGDIYDVNTLVWQGAVGADFDNAIWMPNDGLITLQEVAGQTLLEQRSAVSNNIIERVNYPGAPLGIFAVDAAYIVMTQGVTGLNFNVYQTNEDSDNDGVPLSEDAFPLDPAASIDSDRDGYPDSWNPGSTVDDSTTGLSLDAYAQDSACYLPEHGNGEQCDFNSTMPDYTPDQIEVGTNGIVYLLSSINNRVFRWSAMTSGYINPIYVGSMNTLTSASPTHMTYSEVHQRLYLGYQDGAVTFIDLNGEPLEQRFSNVRQAVTGLAAVGQYILVQDASSVFNTHYIFDENGLLTDSVDFNRYSSVFAWNEVNSRVYFFGEDLAPVDLYYEEVNQTTGRITGSGDTRFNDEPLAGVPPIRVSRDGSRVLLGSGQVYDADSLEAIVELEAAVLQDAIWFGDLLMTVADSEEASLIRIREAGSLQVISEYSVVGATVALRPYGINAIRVFIDSDELMIELEPVGDNDGDGLPAWWENINGLSDLDRFDAGLDLDADGLSNAQEFALGTAANNIDTDSDGLSDFDELNTYLTDPLITDTDTDGLSDGDEITVQQTNPLLQDTDDDGLSDGAEVTEYFTNPLTADTDGDGLEDDFEVTYGLNPLIDDANEDTDNDGLNNLTELSLGTIPNNPDTDSDGLADGDEANNQLTDPLRQDTDGDRIDDGWEVSNSLNPLDILDAESDADNDGFNNLAEYLLESNPNDQLSVPAAMAWTTYQGGADHTGFVPLVLDPGFFAELWNVIPIPGIRTNLNSVIPIGGRIYISEFTPAQSPILRSVLALDAVDGSVIWETLYEDTEIIQPPAYGDGNVYFQIREVAGTYLRSLDAESGEFEFRSSYTDDPLSRPFSSTPTPYAGNIYINGARGNAYSFDADSGAQQWSVNLGGGDNWIPSVDQESVYVYTGDNSGGALSVIDRLTGVVRYSIADPGFQLFGAPSGLAPALDNNQNVIVINQGRLIKFDLQTQSIAWELNAGFDGQPSLALGKVYAVNDGVLSVIDATSGDLLWQWEPPGAGTIFSNLIVTMNLIFMGDATTTYAVDLNSRNIIWEYPETGLLSLSDDGVLYIAINTGQLIAIDLDDDEDRDGMSDAWEQSFSLNDNNPADAIEDTDGDGLTNLLEFQNMTDPRNADSDSDEISDGDEVNTYATDPTQNDSDQDGLDDGLEVFTFFTDPLAEDSDLDGFSDGDEVSLYATDPLDSDSVPAALTEYSESFEGVSIPAGWIANETSDADWVIDNSFASDGNQSIRSGEIADSQQSVIELTEVFEAGVFSFSARVDSESCCDRLFFYVDGVLTHTISSNSWSDFQVVLNNGQHTLEWRYVKDRSSSRGDDAAWVDNIMFSNQRGYVESFEAETIPIIWLAGIENDADWELDDSFVVDGMQSIRSGAITDSQQSSIALTAFFIGGTLGFSARVDAELCCDSLFFYIDGDLIQTIPANNDWDIFETNLGAGQHTLEWRYAKNGSMSEGSDAAWIDQFTFSGQSDYAESFEATEIPIEWEASTTSDADWQIETDIVNDGAQSIRSGAITDSQQSSIELTALFNQGMLSFSARVDAELCCDRLFFYVDGVLARTFTDSTDWVEFQTDLNAGEHTLEWRYVKDGSLSVGADAAWIDNIVFTSQ